MDPVEEMSIYAWFCAFDREIYKLPTKDPYTYRHKEIGEYIFSIPLTSPSPFPAKNPQNAQKQTSKTLPVEFVKKQQ